MAGTTNSVVIDKTGLSGDWFWYLVFAAQRPNPNAAVNPDLPSYPTALREQLGLKLQSSRGPVDVIVIESIQPLIPD
jgi:uncharacterized protein (TIGR03435 family)